MTSQPCAVADMAANNRSIWQQQEIVRLLKDAPGTQYQAADETGQAQIRTWVKTLLYTDEISVTFTKADGTDREMLCTLNSNRIPQKAEPAAIVEPYTVNLDQLAESKKPRKEPDPHSVRVYDLEKQEWRSFRFDRLKKVTAALDFNK